MSLEIPTSALYVGGLDWWISDADLIKMAADIGQRERLKTVVFHEHKINGKSRGLALMEFDTVESAAAVRNFIEHSQQ